MGLGRYFFCNDHGKSPLDHPTMRKPILTLAEEAHPFVGRDHPTMRKLTLTLVALLLIGGSAFAGSFRVHYNVRGSPSANYEAPDVVAADLLTSP
jgi:hypothetical protein